MGSRTEVVSLDKVHLRWCWWRVSNWHCCASACGMLCKQAALSRWESPSGHCITMLLWCATAVPVEEQADWGACKAETGDAGLAGVRTWPCHHHVFVMLSTAAAARRAACHRQSHALCGSLQVIYKVGRGSDNTGSVQLIDDVATMGFSRREVQQAITEISRSGQSVDLNVILDRLMNGPRV